MLIETKNLSLEYKDGKNITKALQNVNLSFDYNGFYGMLGPSGSGKSSLLYLLSGIKKPTHGEIIYCGYPYPESIYLRDKLRRQEMGFIFQSFFLIKYLTVKENIFVGADPHDKTQVRWVDELLHYLGLENMAHKFPDELSGGQRQRVSIARALANKPKVIFADEPTAFLDHENGKKVVDLLKNVAKKACVIIVTHDESFIDSDTIVHRLWDGVLVEPAKVPDLPKLA